MVLVNLTVFIATYSYLQSNFGQIYRRMIVFEIQNKFKDLFINNEHQYSFSPSSDLNIVPDNKRTIVKKTWFNEIEFKRILKEIDGVNTDRYLGEIIKAIGKSESELERVKEIVGFVQKAILHDPYGQPPLAHPVFLMEYGRGHCTLTNQYVLRYLLEKGGWQTRNVQLLHHSVLEVFLDKTWHMVDADMFDTIIVDKEGRLPSVEWLKQAPNYYLIDQFPRARYIFDLPVNSEGRRMTGLVSSYMSEDRGYPSYHLGAPLEFPPSRPRLLQEKIESKPGKVRIDWDSVYDRDGDLLFYRVELGSKPGAKDLGVFKSTEATIDVFLEQPGSYFYRVRGVDSHIYHNPQTFYLPSEEGQILIIAGGKAATEKDSEKRRELSTPRGLIQERKLSDDPSGDFVLLHPDDTYTNLFNVDWRKGNGLRMVDLSDPYSPGALPFETRSEKAQIYRKDLPDFKADDYSILFDLGIKKSGYGGENSFPIIVISSSGTIPRNSIVVDVLPGENRLRIQVQTGGTPSAHFLVKKEILLDETLFHFDFSFEGKIVKIKVDDRKLGMVNFQDSFKVDYFDLASNPFDQVDYILGNWYFMKN
jgi:hypothetical protein